MEAAALKRRDHMRLERDIETKFVQELSRWSYAGNHEVVILKLSVPGFRGWPDRLILWPGRGILFIEFKRPGEQPRKLQEYVHRIIQRLGFEIEVHDDYRIALESVQRKVESHSVASAEHEDHRTGGGV